jgi:hypothetical protein
MLVRAIRIAQGVLGPWSRPLPAKSPLAFRDPRPRVADVRYHRVIRVRYFFSM